MELTEQLQKIQEHSWLKMEERETLEEAIQMILALKDLLEMKEEEVRELLKSVLEYETRH